MLRIAGKLVLAGCFGAAVVVTAQDGPGAGPWEFASAESQGLDSNMLREAAAATERDMGSRTCFVVVKNGKIVQEDYYRGTTPETTAAGWSTTKSMCASLFGIAVEQGWASVDDLVDGTVPNTRQCNKQARYEHVLTMTGTSANIENPRYTYDTLGTNCLDTLQEYITHNNPDGLGAATWKKRFWADVLGLEHMNWGVGETIQCGFSSYTSCRDLARVAQLWANDGAWPGHGQVMSKEYAAKGRTNVFPTKGNEYGYTLWLEKEDPVDPLVSHMNGMFAQCAFHSREHNAVVVTMGNGGGCRDAWRNTRSAIVSRDHPRYAEIMAGSGGGGGGTPAVTRASTAADNATAAREHAEQLAEMLAWAPAILGGAVNATPAERSLIKAAVAEAAAGVDVV